MRYKIYCEAPADRDALVTILAKNGYTVRISKEQKTKNSRYTYYILLSGFMHRMAFQYLHLPQRGWSFISMVTPPT